MTREHGLAPIPLLKKLHALIGISISSVASCVMRTCHSLRKYYSRVSQSISATNIAPQTSIKSQAHHTVHPFPTNIHFELKAP